MDTDEPGVSIRLAAVLVYRKAGFRAIMVEMRTAMPAVPTSAAPTSTSPGYADTE